MRKLAQLLHDNSAQASDYRPIYVLLIAAILSSLLILKLAKAGIIDFPKVQ